MTANKLQVTIETKDGTRTFSVSLSSFSTSTQSELRRFFESQVSLENLLFYCISQTQKTSELRDKTQELHQQNKTLREESKRLQEEIEKLCNKLESL